MTSIAKLTIQGFTFGAALTSGGCMAQNQNELDQMRAELATLKAEVASLKAAEPIASEVSQPSETTETPQPVAPETSAATAVATAQDWQAAIEQHDKEKRDPAWARLREPALFDVAKGHINEYGASLNSVRCKETSCLVTINVPKAPKVTYQPLVNPWAEVTMMAHAKPIYAGRTLWSYLLPRHAKDTAAAGTERVNPLELATKSPTLVKATVVVAGSEGTATPRAAEGGATKAATSAHAGKSNASDTSAASTPVPQKTGSPTGSSATAKSEAAPKGGMTPSSAATPQAAAGSTTKLTGAETETTTVATQKTVKPAEVTTSAPQAPKRDTQQPAAAKANPPAQPKSATDAK